MSGGRPKAQVTFSGVPAWLLSGYLVELGGARDEAGAVRGPGWAARLASHAHGVGGLRIGRVTVTIEGPSAEETMVLLRRTQEGPARRRLTPELPR